MGITTIRTSLVLSLLCLGGAAVGASSGHSATDATGLPAAGAKPQGGFEVPPDAHGNSRTIQMLLQLQGTPAALKGDKSRAADLPDPRQKPALVANPFAPESKRAEPPIEEKPEAPRWTDPTLPPAGAAANLNAQVYVPPATEGRRVDGGDRSSLVEPDNRVDVKSFLPTSWLRFLRENREMVLVCSLVVLALFGFGAAAGSKKR